MNFIQQNKIKIVEHTIIRHEQKLETTGKNERRPKKYSFFCIAFSQSLTIKLKRGIFFNYYAALYHKKTTKRITFNGVDLSTKHQKLNQKTKIHLSIMYMFTRVFYDKIWVTSSITHSLSTITLHGNTSAQMLTTPTLFRSHAYFYKYIDIFYFFL